MSNVFKSVLIVPVVLICLSFKVLSYSFFDKDDNTLKVVYISDLNLYPTPASSQETKHKQELELGLLLYESQAIFLDIIRYLNQKINPEVVIFGGNNVSSEISGIWDLFLDMTSEIKSKILFVFGKNELKLKNTDELVKALNSCGLNTKNTWWDFKIHDYLLVGLDSSLFFYNNELANKQLNWLNEKLNINKNLITILFVHEPLITIDSKKSENKNINKLIDIIKNHFQVKLVVSGSKLLNKTKQIGSCTYLISPSPIAYPNSFKLIELTSTKLRVKSISIPLKGIIKKAEKSLLDSKRASKLFPESPKLIKSYVLAAPSDISFEINY